MGTTPGESTKDEFQKLLGKQIGEIIKFRNERQGRKGKEDNKVIMANQFLYGKDPKSNIPSLIEISSSTVDSSKKALILTKILHDQILSIEGGSRLKTALKTIENAANKQLENAPITHFDLKAVMKDIKLNAKVGTIVDALSPPSKPKEISAQGQRTSKHPSNQNSYPSFAQQNPKAFTALMKLKQEKANQKNIDRIKMQTITPKTETPKTDAKKPKK